MSDPFQPLEAQARISERALRVFAETQYPFIVSTKGSLIAEEPYLGLIGRCNAVVQISCVSPKYDRLEKGAPTFEERIEMMRKLAPNCKRLIVRVQPYTTECLQDVLDAIPRYAEVGVHGLILEGMKAAKKLRGMVRVGADWVYPEKTLESHFRMIRERCHEHGLEFFSGENRLRAMGDSLTCCGCEGVPGFRPNTFNLSRIANKGATDPTDNMKREGTAAVFHSCFQEAGGSKLLKGVSFADAMTSRRVVELSKDLFRD